MGLSKLQKFYNPIPFRNATHFFYTETGPKCNVELLAIRNCKILQPQFLLEFQDKFRLQLYGHTTVMSNNGTFNIDKFYNPSSFSKRNSFLSTSRLGLKTGIFFNFRKVPTLKWIQLKIKPTAPNNGWLLPVVFSLKICPPESEKRRLCC